MKKAAKIILIILLALIVLVFGIVIPIAAVSVYDSVFDIRIETDPQCVFTADDYEGLHSENVSFTTKQGHTLAGYKYYSDLAEEIKGVVVWAHGFGGGGHCGYMPVLNYMASHGYKVFAYDATGNDASEGEGVGGLPQGVIDLDYAVRYVKSDEEYTGLPIYLMGHSWGAYSVGNALNFHPDVKGAVMFAGFDRSELLVEQEGCSYVGDLVGIMRPYIQIYEFLKFGKHSAVSAIEGFYAAEDANILIVHSEDDDTVFRENGYDLFMEEFGENGRVNFRMYETRGHSHVFYTEETNAYQDMIDSEFEWYRILNDLDGSGESFELYRRECIDFDDYYRLDPELMEQILELFADAAEG